jgi:hypothetical protein
MSAVPPQTHLGTLRRDDEGQDNRVMPCIDEGGTPLSGPPRLLKLAGLLLTMHPNSDELEAPLEMGSEGFSPAGYLAHMRMSDGPRSLTRVK